MSNDTQLVLALLSTFSCILLLGVIDPKRWAKYRRHSVDLAKLRVALWLLALAPGIYYLIVQNGADFLIWFGAATIIGWLVALGLPVGSSANSDR